MSLASPNRGYPLERIEGNAGSMASWVGTFDLIAEAQRQADRADR